MIPMFVIYDHPSDYPESFLVRRWLVGEEQALAEITPTAVVGSLEEARAAVPAGLTCLPRQPADDPKIVEVWL